MKKITTISLALLLSACASETYTTDVKSESHREEYKTDTIEQPIMAADSDVKEQDVTPTTQAAPATEPVQTVKVTPKPAATKPVVAVTPPTKQQKAQVKRFGYTVQIVALGSQTQVDKFVAKLPKNQQPIWENYKEVNGTKWFTVLYGDFATRTDAKKAIAALPAEFGKMKPFVKSIDAIKNSDYPTLNKLN